MTPDSLDPFPDGDLAAHDSAVAAVMLARVEQKRLYRVLAQLRTAEELRADYAAAHRRFCERRQEAVAAGVSDHVLTRRDCPRLDPHRDRFLRPATDTPTESPSSSGRLAGIGIEELPP